MTSIIQELSRRTLISNSDVEHIIATAHRRYKVYTIPKRGGAGQRIIAHPARELKALQRALVALSPASLLVHANATAYEVGASILKNAEAHKGNSKLAKFDIINFFNSIKSHHWIEYLNSIPCDPEYSDVSSRIFFWKPSGAKASCLSVGAPSSPFASNRFMHSFDKKMTEYCNQHSMTFTRYADDIAISADGEIDMRELERVILDAFPLEDVFKLNRKKIHLSGKGQRRAITGLIVNNERRVSLGRKRKRIIEAMVHAYSTKKGGKSAAEIRGHLAFLKMIDCDEFARIKKKYEGRVDLF